MLRKITAICLGILLMGAGSLSAQRPNPVTLLEKMKAELAAMEAAKFTFSFTALNTGNQSLAELDGEFIAQGQMFLLSTDVSTVYCDGQTKWILDIANNEMMIFPHDASSSDIAENPFAVLINADLKEYNVKPQIKKGSTIILTPKANNASYTQVAITLNLDNYLPSAMEYITINGDTYSVVIHSTTAVSPSDLSFFTPSQELLSDPDMIIVDMR